MDLFEFSAGGGGGGVLVILIKAMGHRKMT